MIHYKAPNGKAACNYASYYNNKTDKIELVTCKKCLRSVRLKKEIEKKEREKENENL